MASSYITVEKPSKFTLEDRKSVFIAHCTPCESEEEAIEFIGRVKKTYPDAKHHVYAYSLLKNSTSRFSDDREPQGTAGLPVLDAMRKNGVQNACIVVVRYFGGVLLGTGGLVHAYGQSALGALIEANIITYDIYSRLTICTDYSDYQKLLPVFSEFDFLTSDTEYTERVKISGSVISNKDEQFILKVKDVTAGKAEVTKIDEIFDYRK